MLNSINHGVVSYTIPAKDDNVLFNILSTSLIVSYFFEKMSVDVGFYLQLYMVMSIIIVAAYSRVFIIKGLIFYEWFLLIFYIYYAVGTIITSDHVQALRMFFGITIFIFCYFTTRFVFYKIGVEAIEQKLIYTGFFFLSVSIIFYVIGLKYFLAGNVSGAKEISYGLMNDRGMPRLLGVAFNPDYYFMFVAPFLFLYLDKSMENKIYFIPFFLAVISVVLTLSISAYAAACTGFITYFLLAKRYALLVIIVAILACSLFMLMENFPFVVNIIEVRSSNLESGSGRYELWRYAFSLFMENSIFGVGTNGLKHYTTTTFDIINVHSTYLEILVESGLTGTSIYMAFLLMFAIVLVKEKKRIRRFPFLLSTLIAVFTVMLSVSATIHPSYLFVLLLSYTYISAPRELQDHGITVKK